MSPCSSNIANFKISTYSQVAEKGHTQDEVFAICDPACFKGYASISSTVVKDLTSNVALRNMISFVWLGNTLVSKVPDHSDHF